MADVIYTTFKRDLLNGSFNLAAATLRLELHTSAYVPSVAHVTRADLTSEVVGAGYVSGGNALSGQTVASSGTTGKFSASAVAWPTATITARYAVLYKQAGGAPASTDPLICCFDLGADITSTAATFTVTFSASGVLIES